MFWFKGMYFYCGDWSLPLLRVVCSSFCVILKIFSNTKRHGWTFFFFYSFRRHAVSLVPPGDAIT